MNCPHCHEVIDDALVLAARNSLIAKRPRPGARGLVRNPAGAKKKRKARCTCRAAKRHVDCLYCGVGGPCTHVCGVCHEAGIDGPVMRSTLKYTCKLHRKEVKK